MSGVSHNPFRTPAVSPNPTGFAPNNSTQQHYAPPSNSPPNQQRAPPSNSSAPPPDPTGLTEEAPPAYTTRPDVYQGESTLEYGPSRPFQQAPPPLHQLSPPAQNAGWAPPQQQQQPAPSLWQQLTGQITGTSTTQFPPTHWSSAYPGRQQQQQQQQYAPQPQQFGPPPAAATATTSGTPTTDDTRLGVCARLLRHYHYPAGISRPRALPPPNARTPSPTGTGAGRGTGAGAGLPDDGRPTSTPVPGHPLLLNGNMLVYPPYHECHKCNNTGFKHGDPSRPCHKCWNRYARPYAGALAYAPGSPSSSPSSFPSSRAHAHAHTTFQRPLPRLSNTYLAPPALPPRPASYPPPPSAPATVYAPGDARMGGAPCWRCAGRGTLSFLVFESIPCGVCRGVGRVYG
ncbi:hypothetical protein MVEN_00921000 [Mycena venus]|uniref:Uncharacterized protein n=1 Tax=Mycena venus TaxID=2733690 RepID=A0A8H6Y7W3_9AGAR|nr:hypothetical protein MVEN_00921000 [Mycena venus]